jgi:hypothetical protein
VAVQPNTDGYLSRSTNLPSNATGWALCFWFRKTGSVGSGLLETLFEIVDNGDTDYLKVYADDTQALVFESVNDYENVSLFTPTTNTWYFVCIRTTSATTGDILWRADSATSFSSSTGRKFQTDGGWDVMTFLNNAGTLEPAQHFEAFALKLFIGTLTDAQAWEQSVRMLPRAVPSALDSYVPLYTNSGADEGGRARSWTVTGTLATVTSQPRISRGGVGRSRFHRLSASQATLPLATAAGAALAFTVSASQPVSPPLASASASALALSAGAVQPVTLPLATASAQAPAPTATASGSATLPLASGAAAAPTPVVNVVQPVTLPLIAGAATSPALTAGGEIQPAILGVGSATATALAFTAAAVSSVQLPLASAVFIALSMVAGLVQASRSAVTRRRGLRRGVS